MTNKFKTLLKTSVALVTLMAGSQSWGAAVWLDPITAEAQTSSIAPTGSTLTYVLTDGTAAAALAINPAAKAGKALNMSVAAQTAAPGAVTFTPSSDCVVNLDCAASTAIFDVFTFNLAGTAAYKVTLNLKSGAYTLNASSGGANLKVTVNILGDATITFGANEALGWNYNVKKGVTLTSADSAPRILTGKVSASGAKLVTPAFSLTIPLK